MVEDDVTLPLRGVGKGLLGVLGGGRDWGRVRGREVRVQKFRRVTRDLAWVCGRVKNYGYDDTDDDDEDGEDSCKIMVKKADV